jgi:hypothetical protein
MVGIAREPTRPSLCFNSMMPILALVGAGLVGALFWAWRRALLDVGLAAVATALCVGAIGSFGIAMVLAVM